MKRAILFFIILFFSINVNANIGGTKRTEAEIICLAENLYHETKGESYQGILAVANVTMNRVKSGKFPNNICQVVKQRNLSGCQFSWVCQRKRIDDKKKFFEMIRISEQIMSGRIPMNVVSYDVLWYHSKHVKPYWSRYGQFMGRIGSHLFYKGLRNR